MTRMLATVLAIVPAAAFAADDKPHGLFNPSLANTDFIVAIGFVLFLAVLFYFNVPSLLMGLLDNRAEKIRSDLAEARALRDEAQELLANYERKQREVSDQAERIVAAAREDASAAAEEAKGELARSIERRLKAAEDQIANAEEQAVRQVRDRAIEVAIASAGELLSQQTTAAQAGKLIDAAIEEAGQRLH